MYETYRDRGFEIIAFPANQFGCQAPGTSEMERAYAYKKFGVDTFPVMDKIAVKAKPVKCKGIDPASYEEFKDDPDAVLTAPLVDDVTSSAKQSPVYEFFKETAVRRRNSLELHQVLSRSRWPSPSQVRPGRSSGARIRGRFEARLGRRRFDGETAESIPLKSNRRRRAARIGDDVREKTFERYRSASSLVRFFARATLVREVL